MKSKTSQNMSDFVLDKDDEECPGHRGAPEDDKEGEEGAYGPTFV